MPSVSLPLTTGDYQLYIARAHALRHQAVATAFRDLARWASAAALSSHRRTPSAA